MVSVSVETINVDFAGNIDMYLEHSLWKVAETEIKTTVQLMSV